MAGTLVPVNAAESVAEVLAEGIEPMTRTAVAPNIARRRRAGPGGDNCP